MDRQTIMETNRSLRTIKTELENLLEKGIIDDAVFDTITNSLPAETPLRGAAASNVARSTNQTPVHNAAPISPPTQAFQNLNVNGTTPAPPSYDDTPAPGIPSRSPAGKPIIANARALYHYAASDARDLSLEKDDKIDVYEYMNQDWWMGRNQRTGSEGIFPQNYVLVEHEQKGPMPPPGAAYPQQPTYGYPANNQGGPPAQQNPYNASVPPMAVAEGGQPADGQQGGENKVGQYGKKFGKKLGNAAIFGAGASIGSNIVNSIF